MSNVYSSKALVMHRSNNIIGKVLGVDPKTINKRDSFIMYGCDSFDFCEILDLTEAAHGISLPNDVLMGEPIANFHRAVLKRAFAWMKTR